MECIPIAAGFGWVWMSQKRAPSTRTPCASRNSVAARHARSLRTFPAVNFLAKRMECVQLAGAFVWFWTDQKREQAPRTPHASRDSVAARHARSLRTFLAVNFLAKRME